MKLVAEKINVQELKEMSEQMFGNLVKAVVDVEKEIMVVDAGLHSDEEAVLLDQGSDQKDLWGINIYPKSKGDDFIEFDSMINIRPGQGNNSRSVEDEKIKEKIKKIVRKLVNQ